MKILNRIIKSNQNLSIIFIIILKNEKKILVKLIILLEYKMIKKKLVHLKIDLDNQLIMILVVINQFSMEKEVNNIRIP